MVTNFRKAANSLPVRILLFLVALSFVGFGASHFLEGNSKGDVITFSKADSIAFEDFLALKAKQIEYIQRQNNINLTEEQIAELNLDNQILRNMTYESMIKYLATMYNLEISDELVINFAKKQPYFQDENGDFSLAAFKSAFRHSQKQEDEYLENLKSEIIKTTMLNIFMESFQPSKAILSNVFNYIAQVKNFDIVTIDLLNNKNVKIDISQINEDEMKDFYNQVKKQFILPESRSFDYLSFDKKYFAKKIKINQQDIKNYYEENKDEFGKKTYANVKKEIKEILLNFQIEDALIDLVKIVEEEVANGKTLAELAKTYGVKIQSVNNITRSDIAQKKEGLAYIADAVFEMTENEISYPLELLEEQKMFLVELKNITLSKQQTYDEVKTQIASIIKETRMKEANIAILNEVKNNYISNNSNKKKLETKGITVKNTSLTRVDLESQTKINPRLAALVMQTEKNNTTKLIANGNKAIFAFIKDDKIDKKRVKSIEKKLGQQINNALKEAIIQELIGHLAQQNDIKVHL